MGVSGKPGASLRAFRDFCPNALIFGADIDRRVLFSEDRISTFYVDQTELATFARLSGELPCDFDLIIDDGLHSPDANINTLTFALPKLKCGGWAVIEDICVDSLSIWQLVTSLLPPAYKAQIFQADGGLLFAVQRLQ
jgi:hypothetical protein